jgi:transcriptional regulator with GAF, ATPase, and Fis domain
VTVVSTERLADVFVEVADTLVDEYDVIEFLQMVTDHTADLVGASDVGLLLADQRGRLQFMAASNANVKGLELFQVQNQEGPCLDAFRSGRPVVNAHLQEAVDRWPLFAPRAASAGFRSVHAIPMRLRSEVIGALGVFGTEVGRLGAADVKIVQALADVATIGLLQERAVRRAELLSEQLQSALNSRVVIEQAKGAIAQFRNVSVDEAFILLRTQARGSGCLLGDLAQGILTDPGTLPELFKAWPTEEGVDPSRAEGKVKHPDQHGEHEDQNS